jgi:plastocyanin
VRYGVAKSARCTAFTGWAAAVGAMLLLISSCGPSRTRVTHRVEITAMRFEPALIQVAVGDTVRWTNVDLVPHTATSREGTFDSGDLPPGSFWAVVVAHGGILDYTCRYHPVMKGSIVAGSGSSVSYTRENRRARIASGFREDDRDASDQAHL